MAASIRRFWKAVSAGAVVEITTSWFAKAALKAAGVKLEIWWLRLGMGGGD